MVHDETTVKTVALAEVPEKVVTDDETRVVRRRRAQVVTLILASVVDMGEVEVLLHHLSKMFGAVLTMNVLLRRPQVPADAQFAIELGTK